jgi:23S rRNA (adenine2503-C2)-methyltransferase
MGCTFCRTATMGLLRNLRPWEITEQVLIAERILKARGDTRTLQVSSGRGNAGKVERRLTNLVFMGMGEPLHNLEGTVTACRILTDESGLAFPPRRITVSTVGIADRIEPFLERTGVNLAVSLNAPDDGVRDQIMPVNRRFDMEALFDVVSRLPLGRRQRVTFEYVLLAGLNDSDAQARDLARRLGRVKEKVKINLIPFNPHEGAAFDRPAPERVEAFRRVLLAGGVEKVHVRRPRGDRILAACGQLALKEGE